MNYVIEGGIDFWSELEKEEEEDGEKICLLSGAPLGENHITLKCGHSFNYMPLFLEMRREKTVWNPKETQRILSTQIKCPYCRQVQTGLLPYVPTLSPLRINGVNTPQKYSMTLCHCEWTMQAGKRKGEHCGCDAFHSKYGARCEKHWRIEEKQEKMDSDWSDSMEAVLLKNSVADLRTLLGARGLARNGTKRVMILRLFLDGYTP